MYNAVEGIRVTTGCGMDSLPRTPSKKARLWHRSSMLVPAILGLLVTTTGVALATSPPKVRLGDARRYAILSESGITDVYKSRVRGDVGVSPITGAADLLSCGEVMGRILSVDATGPAPCNRVQPRRLGNGVGAMRAAYTDAASRTATVTELGAGNIGGLTLPPGVYSWSSSVLIPSDVTLLGGPKDVWIFQIAQDVDTATATSIRLRGGALPEHVFWQVAGAVNMGTYSHFQGIVLSKTSISMATKATIHGRLYAQTAVTLQMNDVLQPLTKFGQ